MMIEVRPNSVGYYTWRITGRCWNGCFDTAAEALAHAWAVCGGNVPALVFP